MTTIVDPRAMYLEPNTLAWLKTLETQGGPPIYTLSPTEARSVLVNLQSGAHIPPLPADSEDRIIRGGPIGEISLRIIRPPGVTSALPGIVYFHGGGWVLGDKETHDRLIRELANGAGATVVFVDYTRSPEARYPVAIEQAYAATNWVAENGTLVGVDPSRLVVAGDSVGGNMATTVAMLAKERGGPKIGFQALFYPVTDANFENQSYQQFGAGGYWLTRDAMRWFWDSYAPEAVRNDPKVSPLQASLEQLRGLPPALVITDENDVLRDEGEAYAHKLMAAGVPTVGTRYLGTIHDFMLLNPITPTPAARAAISQVTNTLRIAFTQRTA